MRVAVVITTYEDRAESGGFIHLFQSAKRWRGAALTFFGPEAARERVRHESPAADFVAVPSFERYGNRAVDYALRTLAAAWKLPRLLRGFDTVYVLSQSLPDIVPAVLANRRRTVAQVFHLQPLPWKRPGSIANNVFAYASETLGVAIVRLFVRNVIVLTPSMAPKLRLPKKARITSVGSGTWTIPIEHFLNERSGPPAGIAYVGRLHPAKGLDDVLDAWQFVTQQVPDAVLTLVGSGDEPYLEELRKRIERLGIGGSVRFAGFVTNETKAEILAGSRGFVSASREEGWGISVAEALAMGVPCVTYELPVFREVFTRGRIGVPIGDVRALAGAMTQLLQDDELYRRLSREGRELAGALSWDAVARSQEEAIEAAAKSAVT